MVFFLHHEPSDKRDRHRGNNEDHDDPGCSIVVAYAACIEHYNSRSKHYIGSNAGEKGHQPRPYHQLRPLVIIGGHGAVEKKILIERAANVINEVKHNDPGDGQRGRACYGAGKRKQGDGTDRLHDNADEEKGLILADPCAL